ncbi:MAG: acetyl-CoA carboxylase biotin carboxyl carrier protein subunit [Euryarchaeota archaeon]|nr:acetyl-CoA carboxylase biotin carboxyl carrier protein subunit [Euryarchaeota archaeon]|tara:strand:- start:34 stop:429 length:396 start_codon:yes stop_codon:yes gene_type:complete
MTDKRKVIVDGEEFEVQMEFKDGKWEVLVGGKTYSIESDSPRRPSNRVRKSASGRSSGGSGVVSSAIPGKVVSILVSEGDNVEPGDVVVVLEAMKMQNEIKAAVGGKVKKVRCKAGERVEANVPLLEIEKD